MAGGEPQDQLDYRAILEQVPAIVFIAETGADGRWIYVNGWIEPILGYNVESWLQLTASQRPLHEDDRARVIEEERRIEEEAQSDPFVAEYRMIHRDGHPVWLRDTGKLIRQPNGGHLWYAVLHDISEQKRAEAELERQSAAQAAVAQLGEHALERIPIQDLLNEACDAAARVLGVEVAVVVEVGSDQDSLDLRAVWNSLPQAPLSYVPTIDPVTQVGAALRSGRPSVVEDWESETVLTRAPGMANLGTRSSICVRIEGTETPWGCFAVMSPRVHHYTRPDVSFIQSLANVLADAIERQEVEDAIEHRSLHDPLTGLPNRTLFADRLEQAFERLRRRGNSLAAILFIDVDHFKQINDTLGHQAGDELLISVAQRLREAVRPTDTVARRSGDEFVVLLEEIISERDAIATAERIAAGFSRPFALGSGTHFITASLGIALADGFISPSELLENADTAMYRAKERGRARYEMFDEDMRVRAMARMRLESDLSRALDHGELRLVYQPVIELNDESMYGVEALLRWDHPHRGPVPPIEFIPVAEESGLIERIGRWVIEQALHDAVRWAQIRPDSPPLRIGINVSTHQLQSPRFAEMLAEYIAASGVSEGVVHLEIPERVLLDEAEPVRQALRALNESGISLVLDDFGTGESSISHLAGLPLRTLKIDRAFVATLGTNSRESQVAQALIAMGKALSLRVVGEGAETAEQVLELRRLGCAAVQGHLFSPAVPASEITALLQAGGQLLRTLR